MPKRTIVKKEDAKKREFQGVHLDSLAVGEVLDVFTPHRKDYL